MEINVQKINPNAKIPAYAHIGDAGMDIFSLEDVCLEPGERHATATGIALQIPSDHVGLIWDKSGRALQEGLKVMAGVIDAGYRGEIRVVVTNVGKKTIFIKKHEKIAQMLIQPVVSPLIKEVPTLSNSVRGANGFGSTGLT